MIIIRVALGVTQPGVFRLFADYSKDWRVSDQGMIFPGKTMFMKIILDCDLMKHPHSGLYHYCLNLGLHMQRLLVREKGEQIAFYVPAAERQSFGPGANHIVERKGLFKFLNPLFRRCTIWHAPFQSGRMVPDKKRNLRLKVLLTIHDLNALHEGKSRREQRESLARTQFLIDQADAIVCISEFCRNDVLKNCDVKRKPVYVIHNGTHRMEEPKLESCSHRPSRPFLFGMGYINRKKNYDTLLPLLQNQDLELIIAGRLDEPEYVEQMKQRAVIMGVMDRLHLPGPVTEGEKSWYLRHCAGFVHPSLAEGFGAPVVEAMQFGKPLFLSSLTSLPEIAGDVAYYFQSFEPAHMQQVLAEGLEAHKANGMADKIQKKGREYDWELKAKEYLTVYRSLAT